MVRDWQSVKWREEGNSERKSETISSNGRSSLALSRESSIFDDDMESSVFDDDMIYCYKNVRKKEVRALKKRGKICKGG